MVHQRVYAVHVSAAFDRRRGGGPLRAARALPDRRHHLHAGFDRLCCAPEIATLIGARAVQGVGAALLIPCSLAIIGAAFDEQERGAAIGIWSGASALAAGAGPLLGGWLVDHLSWRAIFLINPLIAIPTLWIAVRHLPESGDPTAHAGLDWRGAALAFGGLGSVVYGLIAAAGVGWLAVRLVGPLAAGALLLAWSLPVVRRAPTPP